MSAWFKLYIPLSNLALPSGEFSWSLPTSQGSQTIVLVLVLLPVVALMQQESTELGQETFFGGEGGGGVRSLLVARS